MSESMPNIPTRPRKARTHRPMRNLEQSLGLLDNPSAKKCVEDAVNQIKNSAEVRFCHWNKLSKPHLCKIADRILETPVEGVALKEKLLENLASDVEVLRLNLAKYIHRKNYSVYANRDRSGPSGRLWYKRQTSEQEGGAPSRQSILGSHEGSSTAGQNVEQTEGQADARGPEEYLLDESDDDSGLLSSPPSSMRGDLDMDDDVMYVGIWPPISSRVPPHPMGSNERIAATAMQLVCQNSADARRNEDAQIKHEREERMTPTSNAIGSNATTLGVAQNVLVYSVRFCNQEGISRHRWEPSLPLSKMNYREFLDQLVSAFPSLVKEGFNGIKFQLSARDQSRTKLGDPYNVSCKDSLVQEHFVDTVAEIREHVMKIRRQAVDGPVPGMMLDIELENDVSTLAERESPADTLDDI